MNLEVEVQSMMDNHSDCEHIKTEVSITDNTRKLADVLNLIKKEQQHTVNKNTDKRLILIGSMPRCGSCWLYNCAKLILSITNEEVYHCWIADYDPSNKAAVHLVKCHCPTGMVPELADKADVILSTRRDIREIAGSMVRMNWNKKGEGFTDQLNWIVNTVHPFWFQRSNFEIEYTNIVNNTNTVIETIGHTLGIHLIPTQVDLITTYLNQLTSPDKYDRETQLHPHHRSLIKKHYTELLEKETVDNITHLFEKWLHDFKYIDSISSLN